MSLDRKRAMAERLASLSPKKRALLELQLKKKGIRVEPLEIPPRKETRPDYPLSFAQQRLWFIHQMAPESTAYHISTPKRIAGTRLDLPALAAALASLVRRHETLRTTFGSREGTPVQVVHEDLPQALPLVDLGGLRAADREVEALLRATEHANRPFDLERGPLLRTAVLRLAEEEHSVLLTMHHIISDGWSLGIFFRELMALYEAHAAGRPPALPPLPIQYVDFALWQRDWLSGEELARQVGYWKEQLTDAPPHLDLPTDHPRPPVQSFQGAQVPILLAPELTTALRDFSREARSTLFATLLTAWGALVGSFTGEKDLVVGSPIANRNREEVEDLIGFFVNTLVLRLDLGGRPSFRQLLERVREVHKGANTYQDLPFEKLVEELQPERTLEYNPIFQVSFAFQRDPNLGVEVGDEAVEISSQAREQAGTNFDLWMTLLDMGEVVAGGLHYSSTLFDPTTILRLARRFHALLEGALERPDRPLAEMAALGAAERHQLLVEWRSPGPEELPPSDRRGLAYFFEQAADRAPEAEALRLGGRSMSYSELERRANRLAHHLRGLGVGPEVLVGLALERSFELVVGILGILKAGGAYVPLDPDYPERRLRLMIEETDLRLILTEEGLAGRLPAAEGVRQLLLESGEDFLAGEPESPPRSAAGTDHLAYVMFTSGSTGRPKGVAVPQRAVVRLVRGTDFADLSADQVSLLLAPVSFDASTLELWGSLASGGTLVIHPPGKPSLDELSALLREEGVSILWLTSGLFHLMVEHEIEGLGGLRQLLAGGDVLSPAHVRHLLATHPELTLINGYGPTENTTFTCCHPMRGTGVSRREAARALASAVPIGRPIRRTGVLVLDEDLQPVPIGVVGDLFARGEGLARGYLGQPALTAERFVPDPWTAAAGGRLYVTGDRARWRADGTIDFLGRRDRQVKLRGFRIELEEIQRQLEEEASVQQAAVLVREDTPGDQRLVAYVVQDPEALTLDEVGSEEVVSQWSTLFDATYGSGEAGAESGAGEVGAGVSDARSDFTGWNSSYTGEPIPLEEMREWRRATVDRIAAAGPSRVLEVGCGTGLLLLELAPGAERYVGTDFSRAALDGLRPKVEAAGLAQVRLEERTADDWEGVEPASFDAVVLNSVVQYFPDIDYLLKVVEKSVEALADGGVLFVGDLRSLPMLGTFHASVELARAADDLPVAELVRQIEARGPQEEELTVDPGFFHALRAHLPRVGRVEVTPKRGRHHNELSRFRYDVVVHVGAEAAEEAPRPAAELSWLEWEGSGLDLEELGRRLRQGGAGPLALRRVPNARLGEEEQLLELLDSPEPPATVAELRRRIRPGRGVDPEELWRLAEAAGCRLELDWAAPGPSGRFDAVLHPGSGGRRTDWSVAPERPRPWSTYANRPMQGKLARRALPRLRAHLEERLPEHMLPQGYVFLDQLPLTANGKLDREALPAPDESRPELEAAYVPPRGPEEEKLAAIWAQVLGIDRVGVEDRFFDLGGHSLLAVQLLSRVRREFHAEVSLQDFFNAPTVAGMVEVISGAAKDEEVSELDALFSMVEQMSPEDIAAEIARKEGRS